MKKCDKCKVKNKVYKVHDRDDNDVVKNLCDNCMTHPEYLHDCPHCDALILIN